MVELSNTAPLGDDMGKFAEMDAEGCTQACIESIGALYGRHRFDCVNAEPLARHTCLMTTQFSPVAETLPSTSNAQAFDTHPYQRTEEDDRFSDMVWSSTSQDSVFSDVSLDAAPNVASQVSHPGSLRRSQ
jgi:hypothetical protein